MSINKSVMRVQLSSCNLMSHHLLLCVHCICFKQRMTSTCWWTTSFLSCSFLVAISKSFLLGICLSSYSIWCTRNPTWFLLACLIPFFVIIIVQISSTIHHSCRFVFCLLLQTHEISIVVGLAIYSTIIILWKVYFLPILISDQVLFAFLGLIWLFGILLILIRALRVISLETKLNAETFFVLRRGEQNFQLCNCFSHFALTASIIN